jgi:hypothetical protein
MTRPLFFILFQLATALPDRVENCRMLFMT